MQPSCRGATAAKSRSDQRRTRAGEASSTKLSSAIPRGLGGAASTSGVPGAPIRWLSRPKVSAGYEAMVPPTPEHPQGRGRARLYSITRNVRICCQPETKPAIRAAPTRTSTNPRAKNAENQRPRRATSRRARRKVLSASTSWESSNRHARAQGLPFSAAPAASLEYAPIGIILSSSGSPLAPSRRGPDHAHFPRQRSAPRKSVELEQLAIAASRAPPYRLSSNYFAFETQRPIAGWSVDLSRRYRD